MLRAGAGAAELIERRYAPVSRKVVTICCGKGNNGGDGFVVGRLLHRKGARVTVCLFAKAADVRGDARTMYRRFVATAGRRAVLTCPTRVALRSRLRSSDVIVDALLGTGLSAPVTGPLAEAIEAINEAKVHAGAPVVAIDIPSGIDADSGAVLGTAVSADTTATFGLPKLGLYIGPGLDHAGRVEVVDIGIPHEYVDALESTVTLITRESVRHVIPSRPPSAHKGTYGHAAIMAGSVGKTGAAAMAAMGALRVGTGLVSVATPASCNDVLEAKLLEAMTAPMPETDAKSLASSALEPLLAFVQARTAAAIGPGLTVHPDTSALVRRLLERVDKPMVVDADGLNALTGHLGVLAACKHPPVLTPHPGEMARLEDQATAHTINADRLGTATRFARQHRVILVLKGARTIVADTSGAAAICPTGNPGMATAGTGDVLTGMIAGLLAQRLPPWEAACAATYLHGLAGDLAAARLGQAGMTARDVLDQIPYALSQTV